MPEEKKQGGLRFEIFPTTTSGPGPFSHTGWRWRLVGKDGIVCVSYESFPSDVEARSHLAKNKGRLKTSGFAKVINVDS